MAYTQRAVETPHHINPQHSAVVEKLLSGLSESGRQTRTWRPTDLRQENARLRQELVQHERLEDGLRRAKIEAETEQRRHFDFVANASHEVRLPVNCIIGMTDLVLQTDLDAEQREYLNLVKISANMLLAVVNDLLDLSRIEAGRLALEYIPFSLRECIGDMMKTLALNAQQKNIELVCDIAPEVPEIVSGDPVRLRQVVSNLVSNAVKFTESGNVILQVRQIRAPGTVGDTRLHFAVIDSGIGVAQEKIDRIFVPFFQAEDSTARLYGGTGLGLTIAAKLVQQMGAAIHVESEPGHGSVFQFALTFAVPDFARGEPHAADFGGRRALVAETHPTARRFLVKALRQWNFEVEETADGAEAMTLIVKARREQRPYQVAVLAENLASLDPDIVNGRASGETHRGVENIIVVGPVLRQNASASRRGARMLNRLSKPVKQSELLDAVLRDEPQGILPPLRPTTEKKAARAMSVLVVEDDPIGRQLARHVLARVGHRVTTAENGADALKSIGNGKFDLVLMDLQMPGMNGIEATKALRQREAGTGEHLPVIALTARARPEDSRECLLAGMDACLVKPIQPADLLKAIERLGTEFVAPTPLPVEVRRDERGAREAFDRQALCERASYDRRLLGEVVDLFLRRSPALVAAGKEALARGDVEQFGYAVHTLCGMLRSLSAHGALQAIEELQRLDMLKARKRMKTLYVWLECEIERLKTALKSMTE